MTGRALRQRPAGLSKDRVKPLLRVVGGQQTDAAAANDDSDTPATTTTTTSDSPRNLPSSSRRASLIKSTTPPPPPQLSEDQINATPKSSSSDDEESAFRPGEEEPSSEMKQDSKPCSKPYSKTLKLKPFPKPRLLSTGSETGTPQRSSGIGASPKSLKRPLDDPIMDDGIFGLEGPSKKSKGYGSRNTVYGHGTKKESKYPTTANFHIKEMGAVNGNNGAKNDDDSDSDSKPASSRRPLSNTTNTHKLKRLESPKSTRKTKAKLHIIGDPDTLSAPSSSYNSNGVSPARSTKSIKFEHSPNSDLSSPPSSAQLEIEQLELEDELKSPSSHGNYDQPVDCPMCGHPVDALELSSWQRRVGRAGRSMRIGDQIAFCEAHKTTEAQQEYAARSYPVIDFDALPGRIERFRPELLGILHDTRPSHFRSHATDTAAKGQLRNLAAAQQNDQMGGMSAGYYGPRGRRIMERWVTAHLAERVRERAAADRLIAFKTPAGFMQEVLVPELATWLIMEDKRDTEDGEETGEARAREILCESGPVGDIVHRVVEGEPRRGEHGGETEWGDGVKVDNDDDGEDD